jgi:predicted TIM-barrel fold metal-dependent hydrolase
MAEPASRIDVHHHVMPEFYMEAQRGAGITGSAYRAFPEWSTETSLGVMDANRVALAMLSYSSPGIYFGDLAQTRDLARRCNDFLAELTASHPDRFGAFATLPLPDIDASLAEMTRALDELGHDGITLLTSVDERYIGHADFEPIYQELHRRKAVAFIHPCYPPGTEAQGWDIPRMLIDYPFETTRVATNLILNGVMERLPDIRFILSHAGGTLPFLAHRIAVFDKMTKFQDNYPAGATAYMRRFFYDTALSGADAPMAALLDLVDPSQILFGTDHPYISDDVVAAETAGLDRFAGLDDRARRLIDRGNAEVLFPRLAG